MADDTTNKKTRKNNPRLARLLRNERGLEKALRQIPVFPEDNQWSPRRSARELRARMTQFSNIYHAAWFVRYASVSFESEYRNQKIDAFWEALLKELEKCEDREALLYAVADSITAFPHGLPWES